MSQRSRSRTSFSIHARLTSFNYPFRGMVYLVRSEHNAWLHLAATLVAIGASFILRISAQDWRWIGLAIALVWMAEAFNTAIERLCDVVCAEFDSRIGMAKDVAAGGVLIAAAFALLIGATTLGPYASAAVGFGR